MSTTSINRNNQRCASSLSFLLLAAVSTLVSACSFKSDYMKETLPQEASSIEAAPLPQGQAAVTFIRPSPFAYGIGFTILDGKGQFLGDSSAKSRFTVYVPAGHHEFIAWSTSVDILTADLQAGKRYFVEVALTPGAWSPESDLLAIKPGEESWRNRQEWITDTTLFIPNTTAGQQHLATRAQDVAEKLQKARETLQSYNANPAELAKHTLKPSDGI